MHQTLVSKIQGFGSKLALQLTFSCQSKKTSAWPRFLPQTHYFEVYLLVLCMAYITSFLLAVLIVDNCEVKRSVYQVQSILIQVGNLAI